MPSVNKTENLGLNLWQGNEYVKREDFVKDNKKIDGAYQQNFDKIDRLGNDIATPSYSNIFTTKNAVTKITTDTRKQLKLVNIKGKTIADGVNPEKSIENAKFETKDIANNLISKATISHQLRSLSDAVYDEVNEGILTKRIEKEILDNKDWGLDLGGRRTGYCVVRLDNFISTANSKMYKYNNKILEYNSGIPKADTYGTIGNVLVVGISNTDSGWGDDYIPTPEEIKAYFMGYYMFSNATGEYGNNYNRKDGLNKEWIAIAEKGLGTNNTNTKTVPISVASFKYTPYRLYYQLAKPQTIDLNLPNLVAEPNGSLIITSDYGIVPETQYQLCDNLKSNVDELMVNVNKETNKINTLESKLNNISNPNLLINGDFQVWQRGEKLSPTYGGKYCSDRWMLGMSKSSGIAAKKVKNGINITRVINDSIYYIGYHMEQIDIDKIKGKTCTLSLLANGKIYKKTGKIPESFAENEFIVIIRNDDYNAYNSPFCIRCDLENNNITIEYIKLELGEIATPFVPRSYAEELAMCQRYYLPIPDTWFTGHKLLGSNVRVGIPLSTTMRIIPTLVNQNIQYYTATGWTIASELNVNSFSDTMISLSFNTDLSDNMSCLVKGIPDLDAEIY